MKVKKETDATRSKNKPESKKKLYISKNDTFSYVDRVTIIAIGVDEYEHLAPLSGPKKDVERIENLLTKEDNTALYENRKFIKKINPTSEEIRKELINYSIGRSAAHDILILYFSGHSTPIGHNDLGLCMKDTCFHPEFKHTIPLSLIRISEIIETLSSVKVDPVIIIDSCYSGLAGETLSHIYSSELKRNIQSETGSTYALLCACTKYETAKDSPNGGFFSNALIEVAKEGLGDEDNKRKPVLNLKDIFNSLRQKLEVSDTIDFKPQLFIGETLPPFGFVRNDKYSGPTPYTLFPCYFKILEEIWNDGNPRAMTIDEIADELGRSQYTYYSKLRFWGLIEKTSNKSEITQKGIDFMSGKSKIPINIIWNNKNEQSEPYPGTEYVDINYFKEKLN